MRRERKWVDPALRLPFSAAPSKIMLEAGGGLVTLLGGLGVQLHDKVGDLTWEVLQPLLRRHRNSGDVAMGPFQAVMSVEPQCARYPPVEGNAEGIEVA